VFQVFLLSLVAPLFLLPIEKVFSYPHIAEELVKLLLAILLIRIGREEKKKMGRESLAVGFVFALSESVFYLNNILTLGNPLVFFQRLFLTGILHGGTMIFLYFLGKRGCLGLAAGFILSVVIHYWFNSSLSAWEMGYP